MKISNIKAQLAILYYTTINIESTFLEKRRTRTILVCPTAAPAVARQSKATGESPKLSGDRGTQKKRSEAMPDRKYN